MQGSDALTAVLTQLEGLRRLRRAWETEIIPARIAEYDPAWLDEHCRAGRFMWTRLAQRAAAREEAPRAASPCAPRRSCCWHGAMPANGRV